ncbi:MAG TPA: PEP-CTERM sorting domain-containing protein [Bryobacteraceae bacterium]|mgnify:CR=1 FL=1|nr:PEP-CTERM sorting domain-containing protein [Bryobacteraceae bacterium]
MKSIVRLPFFTLLVGALSFAATIDNYNGAPADQIAMDSSANGIAVTSILDNRVIFANKSGTANSNFLDAIVAAAVEGTFDASAGYNVYGVSGATYTGLWNLASSAQGFSISLIGNDLAGSTIAFWISDGTHIASSPAYSLAVIAENGPAQTIYADFSSFSGINLVNLSAITSLGFTNTHVANGDLSLDNFQTTIPEPGTYAMMAAGLLGLFALRRKKA